MARLKEPIDWHLYSFTLAELPFLAAKESTEGDRSVEHKPNNDEPAPVNRCC
jgi:hypothetical protein